MSSHQTTNSSACHSAGLDLREVIASARPQADQRIGTYFPQPYPDELIYSVIARFSRNSGITTKVGSVSSILFGRKGLIPVVPLPRGLEHLAGLLPAELQITAEVLLNEHTLFNYMFAFETEARRLEARRTMMDPSPNSKPLQVGQMMPFLDRLRYCPQCNEESTQDKNIGDMYWHRKHQLPGLDICVAHERPLCVAGFRISSALSGVNYHAATSLACPNDSIPLACPDDMDLIEEQMQIGTVAIDFLDPPPTQSAGFTRSSYLAKLKANGMPTKGIGWRDAALSSIITRWPRMFDRYPHLREVPVWLFDILVAGKVRNSVILHAMVDVWASAPPTPKAPVSRWRPSARCSEPSTVATANDATMERAVREAARSIRNAYPYLRVTKSSIAREAGLPRLIRNRYLVDMPHSIQAIEEEVETLERYLIRCGRAECESMRHEGLPIFYSNLAIRLRMPRDKTVNGLLRNVVSDFLGQSEFSDGRDGLIRGTAAVPKPDHRPLGAGLAGAIDKCTGRGAAGRGDG